MCRLLAMLGIAVLTVCASHPAAIAAPPPIVVTGGMLVKTGLDLAEATGIGFFPRLVP